jgi:hypothetical protein
VFGRIDSSAFLLNPLDPPELRDSADRMEDECLLLTADQAELLDTFRKDVRLCETDEEKFQLCAQMRSRLLDQYTQVHGVPETSCPLREIRCGEGNVAFWGCRGSEKHLLKFES